MTGRLKLQSSQFCKPCMLLHTAAVGGAQRAHVCAGFALQLQYNGYLSKPRFNPALIIHERLCWAFFTASCIVCGVKQGASTPVSFTSHAL